MTSSWATKYRPHTFAEVLGQSHVSDVLKARLRGGTGLQTSYLLAGPSGHGKTTLGRIFGRALICQSLSPDTLEPCNQCENCLASLADQPCALVEIDAATGGTVDAIRSILESIQYPPLGAKKWVYLIDETHRLSKAGQDALLKPIEEGYLVCLFCTTEPEAVRDAIQGRCERHHLRKVNQEALVAYLSGILTRENVTFDADAVRQVIGHHRGQVRDILTTLETLATLSGGVSLAATAEVLHLGLRSKVLPVWLALAQGPSALCTSLAPLVEEATPEDILEALTEAAMTAYKVTLGVATPSLLERDKPVAVKVGSLFKDHLPRWTKEMSKASVSTLSDLEALLLSLTVSAATQERPCVVTPASSQVDTPPPSKPGTLPAYDPYVAAKPAPPRVPLAKPTPVRLDSPTNGNTGEKSKESDLSYRGKGRTPIPPEAWREALKSAARDTSVQSFLLRFGLGGVEGVGRS